MPACSCCSVETADVGLLCIFCLCAQQRDEEEMVLAER